MRLLSAKISALWARDPACRLTGQAGRRWSFSMTSRLTVLPSKCIADHHHLRADGGLDGSEQL